MSLGTKPQKFQAVKICTSDMSALYIALRTTNPKICQWFLQARVIPAHFRFKSPISALSLFPIGVRGGGGFYFAAQSRSRYLYPITRLSLSEVTEFSLSLFSACQADITVENTIFVINSSAVFLTLIPVIPSLYCLSPSPMSLFPFPTQLFF